MYQVQKNVEIPSPIRDSAFRKYPLDTMEVGEMFFIPHRSENTMSTYISAAGKKLGRKFETRLTWMALDKSKVWQLCNERDPGAVQGIGIWRKS